MNLGFDQICGSSFDESGNKGVRLPVDTDDGTYVSLAPAIEFGGEFVPLDGVQIRPHVTVGLTQYLNSLSPSLTAKFVDAVAALEGFDVSTDIATTFFELSGDVDNFAMEHAVLRAGAFTDLSRDDNIYGGSLWLEVPL